MTGETDTTRPVRAAVRLLEVYQTAASGRISPCRFYPSCSQYSAEAFSEHGFWRGFALTTRRLVRCRPFGPHGVDLVPIPVRADSTARRGRTQ
jgi:putative membrane protein insertion efficiency factor